MCGMARGQSRTGGEVGPFRDGRTRLLQGFSVARLEFESVMSTMSAVLHEVEESVLSGMDQTNQPARRVDAWQSYGMIKEYSAPVVVRVHHQCLGQKSSCKTR